MPSADGRLQIVTETGNTLSAGRALEYAETAVRAAEEAARVAAAQWRLETLHAMLDIQFAREPAGPGPAEPGPAGPGPAGAIPVQIDALLTCAGGTFMIAGWIDDRGNPLRGLDVLAGGVGAGPSGAYGRIRRPDVDAALGDQGYSFGFWTVRSTGRQIAEGEEWAIRAELASGHSGIATPGFSLLSPSALRTAILEYFASMDYAGNPAASRSLALGSGIGDAIIALNRDVVARIVANPWVSRYGPARKSFASSIIVCLFGKPEFAFLQPSLFSAAPGALEYEYIYVSNSPDLTGILEKEARLCARIYDVSITLVCLADNAGLGAAHNTAARFARSLRLIFVHPDVFPRDAGWAKRHAAILDGAPAAQTDLFGVPLYYDDGGLMHHGVYFAGDMALSGDTPAIRCEFVGRGETPRPVAAVSGAFISVNRDWFERLGGFNEEYLFSQYEDYDFCLRSFEAGRPAWVQDLPFWHMAGTGALRHRAQEGGALVNRWLFSRKWAGLIAKKLLGKAPARPSA
jgi:GT2 family glycosyltransferase